MTSRLITLWSVVPGAGSRTLVAELARQWSLEGQSVLVITPVPAAVAAQVNIPPVEEWLGRFRNLSPLLLRNYLTPSASGAARLPIAGLPDRTTLKELFALLKRSFPWIFFVVQPEWQEKLPPVLEASDLVLWVTLPGTLAMQSLEAHWQRLVTWHFPNALSQWVLNQAPADVHPLPVLGKAALGRIPWETPLRFAVQEAVRELGTRLRTDESLYGAVPSEDPVGQRQNVVDTIRERIQPQLLQALQDETSQAAMPTELAQKTIEACIAEDRTLAGSREERSEIVARVMEDVMGFGPLEPLLKDPAVTEIMVNGKLGVFVEKKGKLYPTDVQFSSEAQLRTIIDRMVAPIGRRVDESMPLCDARLPDGSRVNIIIPPLALDGPTITIRKFMKQALSFEQLVEFGSMNQAMVDFLKQGVLRRKNIVVSGGTGSGKTTLLNALSGLIPEDERIVTIEDAAELRLQKPHVVRLESRPANAEGEGAIAIRRLVMNALRMRPDRIVVGECRGGEALDMLQAMNTGHDGSLTTVHANSPRDALGRLETLVLMAGVDLPVRVVREQIRSAVHLVIQQSRLSDGARKVTSITEVTGMEGETLTTQEIFRFERRSMDAQGRLVGQFEHTGIVASFLREQGWSHD